MEGKVFWEVKWLHGINPFNKKEEECSFENQEKLIKEYGPLFQEQKQKYITEKMNSAK